MRRKALLVGAVIPLVAAVLGIVMIFFLVREWPESNTWRELLDFRHLENFSVLVLCYGTAVLLRGLRWHLQIGNGVNAGRREIVLGLMWSYFLLTVLPFRAGDLVRLAWIKRWNGSVTLGIGALMAERLADAFVLFSLVGLIAILVPWGPDWVRSVGVTYVVVAGGAYAGAVVYGGAAQRGIALLSVRISQTRRRDRVFRALLNLAGNVFAGLSLGGGGRAQLILLFLTVAFWILMALGFYALVSGMGADLHWMAGPAVLAAVSLSSAVPAPPSGLGVYEGAAVLTLGAFRMPGEYALVTAIGVHASTVAAAALVGIPARLILARMAAGRSDTGLTRL